MALNFLLKRSGTANKRPDPASMALGELDLNYDAVSGGVFYKDSAGDVVKVGSAQVSATAPNATPAGSAGNSDGEFWYDTSNTTLKIWNGSAWVSISGGGGGGVAGVTGTTPITVDNTDPANPVVGVDSASTSTSGVVQLNDFTTSTSTTEAATANAVKTAYDEAALAITDAATAQGTADFAQADATQALSDAAAAQATADAAVPDASYTALGAILTGTGAGTYAALTLGTNTNVLTADSACAGGVKWAAGGGGGGSGTVTSITAGAGLTGGTITTSGTIDIDSTCVLEPADFTASGQLLAGTGTGTYTALAVGSDTQVLTADSACTGGVKWAAAGGAAPATISARGTVYGATANSVVSNTAFGYLAGQSATGTGGIFIGPYVIGCCTGIGNGVIAIGGDTALRFPGADNQLVIQNSQGASSYYLRAWCSGGVCFFQPGGGLVDSNGNGPVAGRILTGTSSSAQAWCAASFVGCSLYSAKGTIVASTGVNLPSSLAVGTNGQVLTADSACTTGLKWAAGGASAATPSAAGGLYGCTTINTSTCASSVGYQALLDLTSGTENTAIGYTAGRDITTGSSNIAIGSRAMCHCLDSAITGSNNIALGVFTLNTITTSSHDIAIGSGALSGTTGSCNIAIGGFAAQAVSTGACNVVVGQTTIANNITGNNNVAIGYQAGTLSAIDGRCGVINITGSNCITIGNCFNTCATIKVAWTVTSDERDKAIDPAGVPYGLAFVNQVEPIAYSWCDRETGEITENRKRFGFSAQNICALETETAQPIIVSTDDPDHLMFTDQMLLPVLVNAIKELSAKNEELEARIRSLEIPG